MRDQARPPAKMTGMTSFAADDADYIAPPSRAVRDQAKAAGASLGFVSDKPAPAEGAPSAPATPTEKAKRRPRLPSQYPDHYNLRLRDGDRERFDDYAYRHRIPKGEVFRIMLDLLEAQEGDDGRAGGKS